MSDNKKCITDITFQKKLDQIKEFKQKVVGLKSEDFKSNTKPILYTGEKAKIKMDSIYSPNDLENSSRKRKLKLITRNDLYSIYLDDHKKTKDKKLQPIKQTIEENKNESQNKSKKLKDIKTNRTVQIKSIKIVAKDEKMSKVILKKNFHEFNKISEEKEDEKITERDKKENQNDKEKENNKEKNIEKKEEKNEEKNKEKKDEKMEDKKEVKKEDKKEEKKEEKKDEKKEGKKEEKKDEKTEEKNEDKKDGKKEEKKVENIKSKELNPIILKGKNNSLRVSKDISIIKNALREDSKEKNFTNRNAKSLNSIKNTTKKEYKLEYCVYPGNNSALIEKVMAHRSDVWEKVPTTFSEFCDLVWSPISCSINFQNCEKRHQYANHLEFNMEISNKMRLFANILKHCEEKKIDAFSIFPFTISFQLTHWSFGEQLTNFKKLYYNINDYTPVGKKKFSDMFNVILSRKIGSSQYINIPPSFNSGKNLWIIKPINFNRGKYITVENKLKEIIEKLEAIQEKKQINYSEKKKKNQIKCEYILIQKYLEKPLLYQERKFDIRLWVLFISQEEDDVYIFRQGHLKATSSKYDPDSKDLFVHLTNYSVQKYNENFSKIEIGNEIPFKDFQNELDKKETGINFYNDIYPKIVRIVRITGGAAKGKMNFLNRKYCFEIFGYDFIIDEKYEPFLLEINTNPGLEISSPLINELLPRMIDDAFKLTIDKEFTRSYKYSNEPSKFHVEGYDDKINMWEKYSVI